jgi:hypothetical protein
VTRINGTQFDAGLDDLLTQALVNHPDLERLIAERKARRLTFRWHIDEGLRHIVLTGRERGGGERPIASIEVSPDPRKWELELSRWRPD